MSSKFKCLIVLPFLAICNSYSCFSQNSNDQGVVVDQVEQSDGSVEIIASNLKDVSQIVVVDFPELTNMKSSVPLPIRKVLQAKTDDILLAKLTPVPGRSYHNQMEYMFYPGNILDINIDKNYEYTLPFEKGKTYMVIQGYGGELSHNIKNHEYGLDFDFQPGEKVCAARSGVVFGVKDDSNRHGNTKAASKYGNFITILHEDGSYANYFHLQQNGSMVSIGDKVIAGQLIGLSGNTGWSSGPHLHFEVYYYNEKGEYISIPTKFKVQDSKPQQLKEERSYTR